MRHPTTSTRPPTSATAPFKLSLADAARAIRNGYLTAEEVTRSCLERITLKDREILAWEWIDARAAVAHAKRADELVHLRGALGRLHGIPIGVKDIIYTKGIPTAMGSPIFRDFIPSYSAACVEKLESAGAFVMGKTVTTEFANQKPGKTRNPWNPRFTPGGSSSGSAAAVAAGFVFGALGSQTRGSTIRPAVYCGIVGYKPSFGVVSRFGMNPLSTTLDHVGILTRTVDDAALMASCMAGHDRRDSGSIRDEELPENLCDVAPLEKPPRLAAVRSPVWSTAESSQRELFAANQDVLRKAGAALEQVELPAIFEAAIDVTRAIHLSEIAHNYGPLMKQHSEQVSARFAEFYNQGLRYSAAEYLDALGKREELRRTLQSLLAEYDAIITPPATGEPPRTLDFTGDANFCTIWTLCGVPCVSFPTGLGPNGLPMGMQVVGGYLNDRAMLRVGKWCMDRLPLTASLPD